MSSHGKIYRLQSKVTGEYWHTGKGRCDFYSLGSLQGATKTSYAPWDKTWTCKEDFEVVEFIVVEVSRKKVSW